MTVKGSGSATTVQQICETELLSSIFKLGKDGFVECIDLIDSESFNGFKNKLIFESMKKLFESGEDFSSIRVFQGTQLNEEEYEAVSQILNDSQAPSLDGIRGLAKTLRNQKVVQDSILLHRSCINKLSELNGSSSLSDIVNVSEAPLFELIMKLSKHTDAPIKFSEKIREYVDFWASHPVENVGIPLPWPKFNDSIGGGLRPGVHLVGARLKVGKTSIGIMTAAHVAIQLGIPVLIIDTEMQPESVASRLIANISQVKIRSIEKGVFTYNDLDKNDVYKAVKLVEGAKIDHKHMPGAQFKEILSTVRRWIHTDVGFDSSGCANPMLLIFDYFKVMNAADMANGVSESQALGFQISNIVDLANTYKFPCLGFAQLNRDGISREDSGAVAASDKLAQVANSLTIFKRKTEEEILRDGPNNGNRKMITTDSRYGGEAEFASQYISMDMKKDYCILQELDFEHQPKAEF